MSHWGEFGGLLAQAHEARDWPRLARGIDLALKKGSEPPDVNTRQREIATHMDAEIKLALHGALDRVCDDPQAIQGLIKALPMSAEALYCGVAMRAATQERPEALRACVASMASSHRAAMEERLLSASAGAGSAGCVKVLLDMGVAPFPHRFGTGANISAMQMAALSGQPKGLAPLLAVATVEDMRDHGFFSLLSCSHGERPGFVECARLILAREEELAGPGGLGLARMSNARALGREDGGKTPLHSAVGAGSLACAKMLAEFSDLTARDQHGRTAIENAERKGDAEMIDFLRASLARAQLQESVPVGPVIFKARAL